MFFGESSAQNAVVKMETVVAMAMLARHTVPPNQQPNQVLHIVMEQFTFEMQYLLDYYQEGHISLEQLNEQCMKFDLVSQGIMAHRELLEFARKHSNLIKLHAGSIPRSYTLHLLNQGEEVAIKAALGDDFIPSDVTTLKGSDLHWEMFKSTIEKSDFFENEIGPTGHENLFFKVQLLKDTAMAHKVNKLIT